MYKINGIEKLYIQLKEGESLYFVTDPHGEFKKLHEALVLLGFKFKPDLNGEVDRLFIIGDMIDRGNESVDLLGFARYNPHVMACRGNHEVIAYHGISSGSAANLALWLQNGGDWYYDHDEYFLKDLLKWSYELPDGYELNINDNHKIGLIHASIPQDPDDELDWETASGIFNDSIGKQNHQLMSYGLENRKLYDTKDQRVVCGVDALLHGHNLVRDAPEVLGNRIYLDGGANVDSESYGITILEYNPEKADVMGIFKKYRFVRDAYTRLLEIV
ncbi:metallophosphoesterase [Vibrio sp. D431a]|uniref:metallophosphoesterase n=1 Tax=Vibrio sp. D431a TaxID=2837388 RepID=UPI0025547FB1|nr:metallophosphoesterase [Vibrio sp. D431a]MDK9790129.1 metallophosphoesterase [Vibrio sp. D431a]